jgi:hypothetical protein
MRNTLDSKFLFAVDCQRDLFAAFALVIRYHRIRKRG